MEDLYPLFALIALVAFVLFIGVCCLIVASYCSTHIEYGIPGGYNNYIPNKSTDTEHEELETKKSKFDKLVEWAYETLPSEVKDQEDFPDIQIMDEPTEEHKKQNNYPPGIEMLASFVGVPKSHAHKRYVKSYTPTVILVFKGPCMRCANGDLQGTVKRVVWHEVAHWLGHDELQVKQLGL